MKVLSLFDGISCARVALNRAGIKVEKYFASEIDKHAITIAQKNFQDTIQIGDIKNIKCYPERKYLCFDSENGHYGYTTKIDLLIGGSPCQDLSVAKIGRQGLKGSRSGLFYEYVRVLKEVKPKWWILENVASMRQSDKDEITKELGVEPIMIDAAMVSAQSRKRLFWTNIPGVTQPEDRHIYLKDVIESGYIKDEKSMTITASYANGAYPQNIGTHRERTVVFNKPIRIGTVKGTKGGQGDRIYSIEGKSVTLSANGGGRGAKTGLYTVDFYNKKVRSDGKSKTLGTNPQCTTAIAGQAITDLKRFVRKFTPKECERLQCLPDDYTEGISNTQRYKAIGNGFNVEVIAHILSFIPKK